MDQVRVEPEIISRISVCVEQGNARGVHEEEKAKGDGGREERIYGEKGSEQKGRKYGDGRGKEGTEGD